MIDWLLELITIPRFELVVAWVVAFMGSMIAGAGWAMYHTERTLSSKRISPPFDTEISQKAIVDNPKDNQDSHNSIR